MAREAIDITGQTFGQLRVIETLGRVRKRDRKIYCLCECSCGVKRTYQKCKITSGRKISCGCHVAARRFTERKLLREQRRQEAAK